MSYSPVVSWICTSSALIKLRSLIFNRQLQNFIVEEVFFVALVLCGAGALIMSYIWQPLSRSASAGFFEGFLEVGKDNKTVFSTALHGICPFCKSDVTFRHRNDEVVMVCQRNPVKHRVRIDMTQLPDLE